MSDILYVYAVVPASEYASPPADAPSGLDEGAVTVEREGPVAALVSRVASREYSPGNVEARTADLSWLGPRAAAHDRIVTWASDRGPAVPLPMFSLYTSDENVRSMLRTKQADLERALASVARGREYTLRVYRDEAAIRRALPALRPEFAEQVAALAQAKPGQRYLLERKLEQDTREATKQVARDVASEVLNELGAHAVDTVREPPPRRAGDPAQVPLALNASFLVAPEAYDAFRATLTSLVQRYEDKGFRFEFTGPWPPYHFVGAGDA